MLPRGPKRGGIRETVGFEERKAERGKMGGEWKNYIQLINK